MSKPGSSIHVGAVRFTGAGCTRWRSRGTAWVTRSMRRTKRATSGGRSSMVMLATFDDRNGSFSRRHMSPSASVIRRSNCTPRRLRPGCGSPNGLPRDRGVLELVQLGPAQEVEDPLDGGGGEGAVALRAVHQPDEHRLAVLDEGGHAPDLVRLGGGGVLG